MTVKVRVVTLSPGADEMLERFADREKMDPDVIGSLMLEAAVRERAELERRLAEALKKAG